MTIIREDSNVESVLVPHDVSTQRDSNLENNSLHVNSALTTMDALLSASYHKLCPRYSGRLPRTASNQRFTCCSHKFTLMRCVLRRVVVDMV
jgi:hypothetical protein